MKKTSIALIASLLLLSFMITSASAHSGGTDSDGGHYDHSSGEYHHHHGESAHDHYDINGDGLRDCPFNVETDPDIIKQNKIMMTIWKIAGTLLLGITCGAPLVAKIFGGLIEAFLEKIFKNSNSNLVDKLGLAIVIAIGLVLGYFVSLLAISDL